MARGYSDVLNGKFGDDTTAPVAALSFIFGSGIKLLDDSEAQVERRIAIYPCITDAELSEFAQGLMCAVAWVLNSLEGITAIPFLLKTPKAEWTPEISSFMPESLVADGLGEDTLLHATLNRDATGFVMQFAGSTELDDVDDLSFEVKASSIVELFGSVINSIKHVSVWLRKDVSGIKDIQLQPGFDARAWLIQAFAWHRETLVHAINEHSLLGSSALEDLITVSNQPVLGSLVVKGIALSVSWFEQVDAAALSITVSRLQNWQESASAIAQAFVELGTTRAALELLEKAIEDAPEHPSNWLVLAKLYAAVQQSSLAVETLQDAIERHQHYAPLLMQYGDVLMSYADQGILLQEVVFIDESLEPAAAFEAIAAYEEAARLLSSEPQAMAYVKLIEALVRYNSEKVWLAFDALAATDYTGTYTELALNAVSSQEDIDRAVEILRKATQSRPDVGHLWRNLAYAQYLAGEGDAAAITVSEALKHASDTRSQGEYELLALFIQDGAIEAELAEIADRLSVQADVTDRTLELLEWIVAEAPHYIEGYLLLGRAYDVNGEGGTALEVLLDAEKKLGPDADIYTSIIDLLLESGEETVALDYVTKALDVFPRHVPLLARAALVTDALGDREVAKSFLRQAHNLVPYHREIMRVSDLLRNGRED